MQKVCIMLASLCLVVFMVSRLTGDWPIYKGNIYFTGNNDGLVVREGKLKWLYQAAHTVQNPVVSGDRVYAVDAGKNLHCLDVWSGDLLWKIQSPNKSGGAFRYPLVSGGSIVMSDSTTLYCFNKSTGALVWSKTGSSEGQSKGFTADGIYALPVIHGGSVLYGTRTLFMARSLKNGGVIWANDSIKTYSGFPSFYDRFVFTQSMDYTGGQYSVYCIEGAKGTIKWKSGFDNPHKIFSPVVYRGKVYIPVNRSMHCLDIMNGKELWHREYDDLITSHPSFTEQEILFTVGNRSVVIIDPAGGEVLRKIDTGDGSSPYFVTIQDYLYIAGAVDRNVEGKDVRFAKVYAYKIRDAGQLWSYIPPFPGAPAQPMAAKGMLIIPAGKCLYAVGVPEGKDKGETAGTFKNKKEGDGAVPPLRDIILSVYGKDNKPLKASAEAVQWKHGRETISKKFDVDEEKSPFSVPDADDVELTVHSEGHLPQKILLLKDKKEYAVTLDPIQKGKSYIIDNILFETDEAYLLPESLPVLNRVLRMMTDNPGLRIEVRGYTDSTGPREHNIILSRRRAQAVVDYLIKNGISPERLAAAGFGPDNPVASNQTAEGRRLNRRTEIYVIEF